MVLSLHVYFGFAGAGKRGVFWVVFLVGESASYIKQQWAKYWHALRYLCSLICTGFSCNMDTCAMSCTKHTKSKLAGRGGPYRTPSLPVRKPFSGLPGKSFSSCFSPSAVIHRHRDTGTQTLQPALFRQEGLFLDFPNPSPRVPLVSKWTLPARLFFSCYFLTIIKGKTPYEVLCIFTPSFPQPAIFIQSFQMIHKFIPVIPSWN